MAQITKPLVLTRITSSNASSGSFDDTAGQVGISGVGEVDVHTVEPAECVHRQPDDRDHRLFVGTVERDADHPLPRWVDVVDHARCQLGIEVADDEPGPLIGVSAREPVADTAQPGEDDDLVL